MIAGAETDAVGRGIDHGEQALHIVDGAENARQPEDRVRRVVRVDDHDAAGLFGDRAHFGEEVLQVRLKIGARERFVLLQHRADVFERNAFEAGEVVDEAGRELFERFRAQGLLEGAGRRVRLTPRGMDVMNAILEEFLP